MSIKKVIYLISGPLLFCLILFGVDIQGLDPKAKAVLATTIWIAIWWITEVIPIAVTALLPLILFPLTGSMGIKETSAPYGHPYVFLYLGGFIIAIAIEKYNLHKRIALNIIRIIGTNIKYIILGFMTATAFLSMWISNTATAVMLLPVGMAIISQLKDHPDTEEDENQIFGKSLMLAIAYSASIGGMATLIGTPPNLVMAGIVKQTYGVEISFSQWFSFAFPITLILLFVTWQYLTKYAFKFKSNDFPGGKEEVYRLLKNLGNMSRSEKKVAIVFFLTALSWILKSLILDKILPGIDDTIIGLIGGFSLFIISTEAPSKPLLNWEDMGKIPWGIILLFGGGMSLAEAFEKSGLALFIGEQFNNFEAVSLIVLIVLIIASVNFLTELTSNLATTAMLLPVLVSVAAATGVHHYYLIVGATLAASCAFMLPVATPPNAVVFGSGYITIKDMMRAGLVLNIISIIIISLAVRFYLPLVWKF
jgi:solute carrier family 13 (sodium-dependent dicarboxylate transporter), member 2/3/5